MTVDTAILRAQWEAIREQQGPAAFGMIAHVGDGIALLDALEAERERNEQQDSLILWQGKALEAERERVRVLTRAVEALRKPVQLWMAVVEESSGAVTAKWGCRSFGECNDLITRLATAALDDDDVRAALATAGGEGATT